MALRKAIYDKLAKLYKYRAILDVCEMHSVKCELTVLEVDHRLCADLERLASKYGFNVVCGWERLSKYYIAVVQNVLHWATDPLQVLLSARRHASRLFILQGVIEGAGIGFILVKVLGAVRSLSWKEVEGLAKEAGWKPVRRFAKYPDYLALFK